jgi:transposase
VWRNNNNFDIVERTDGKITSETIWKQTTKSKDYHDNLNSDIFMTWVNNKLLPCFNRLYEGKQMVLICDNAPYHHKREIGSLASRTKKELVELMKTHEINYIHVPWNNNRREAHNKNTYDHDIILPETDMVKLKFEEIIFLSRPSVNNPFAPNIEELKLGIVMYLKDNNPHLLECKVERALKEHGHTILWTPPYAPELQPIEMFWSIGKGHTALNNNNHSTIKMLLSVYAMVGSEMRTSSVSMPILSMKVLDGW